MPFAVACVYQNSPTKEHPPNMSTPSLTFKQYRSADLTIFAFLTVVFEALVTLGATKWFPGQMYSVKIVYAIFVLVLMRWGAYAGIVAFLSGVAYCMALKATLPMYVIVCGGNLFDLFTLFLHKMGKQKIRDSVGWSILYVFASFACISVGRLLISLVFELQKEVVQYILYDVFSAVFAVVLVLVCRKQNGLFEDQKHYLLRVDAERKAEAAKKGQQ